MRKIYIQIVAGFLLSIGLVNAQQLGFPGAEGIGAYAKGGRGGDMYTVTNLSDFGIYMTKYEDPVRKWSKTFTAAI